eukprot:XP_001706724.1 Hypothetical protein GL50803_19478 [Giardia lamblia ATCC 50803]
MIDTNISYSSRDKERPVWRKGSGLYFILVTVFEKSGPCGIVKHHSPICPHADDHVSVWRDRQTCDEWVLSRCLPSNFGTRTKRDNGFSRCCIHLGPIWSPHQAVDGLSTHIQRPQRLHLHL